MRLENILPVLDEYGKTEIIDTETLTTLARYDGRDAIPESLNGRQIDYITAADSTKAHGKPGKRLAPFRRLGVRPKASAPCGRGHIIAERGKAPEREKTMAYIRNAQDVKERCSESVIFYAERIAAFKKIERQTKKDGKDFSVMSKNFKVAKGCGVYITITDRHTAKDRYKIDISYHGSRGWNDDWLYFENAADLDNKIAALIESDTARKQEREKETEKAERAAAFALEKLAEISTYLDGIKAEKNNTLRYAIGEMVENYRFSI